MSPQALIDFDSRDGMFSLSLVGGDFGVHTQGSTLKTLLEDLKDAVNLHNANCLPYQKIDLNTIHLDLPLGKVVHAIDL